MYTLFLSPCLLHGIYLGLLCALASKVWEVISSTRRDCMGTYGVFIVNHANPIAVVVQLPSCGLENCG